MTEKSGPLTIRDLIFSGNQDPDHPAIESPGYPSLTYRDLRNQVHLVIKMLNGMGFGRNDRIAVIMPGGPVTAVLGIAIMAGFTHAPLNPQFREPEFQVIFPRLKVKAVIVQKNHETAARTVAASLDIPVIEITPLPDKAGSFSFGDSIPEKDTEVRFAEPEDIAMVLQTSGTTSLPKIVPLTQKQICKSVINLCVQSNHHDRDKSLHIVPHFHLLGVLGTLLSPLYCGGTVICTRDFIASDFLALLKKHRPTFYIAGPAHHQAILYELKKVPLHELKNNSLHYIRSVSAPMPVLVRNELETLLGVPLIESYGMTESPTITINFAQKEGSVGIPIVESLAVIHDDGSPCRPFETGEVSVKGEIVFSGYEDAPVENASAFINGWFRTGDMGYLDSEGYLYLTGRKKELVNKGGEKISPVEIDQVLMTHPAVKQAMAFRISDLVLGEDIAAMVVLENKDTTKEELRTFLLERLVPFKVPRGIYFVDEIPKGPTGKLLRYVGTDRYARGEFKESPVPVVTGDNDSSSLFLYQEKILGIWKEILDVPSLSPDDDFFRSGGNSLAAIELLIKIQRAFNLALPPDTVYLHPTIRQQAAMIAGKTGTDYHPLIVPIREQGTLPPLFCIHSVGGWIGTYQNIFKYFNQDRPVFGIRARGLEPGEEPLRTVEAAVREYTDAIKTVQGKGPYHLLGYSAGAIYAYELACQLQKKGESVVYLGNIDQSVPRQRLPGTTGGPVSGRKGRDTLRATGLRMYHFLNNRLKKKPGGVLPTVFTRGITALQTRVLHEAGSPPYQDWILSYPEKQQPLLRIIKKAVRNYQPPVFSGDLILFSTGPDPVSYPGDPARGWNAFITGKTTILDICGDHGILYLDPYAQAVAQKIEESLKSG